jgi:hypothetical protein
MTLRDTELIGKKLVKYGFYRSNTDHQDYRLSNVEGAINIYFKKFGQVWVASIFHDIDFHTKVKFEGHQAVFTPEWVVEEHKKLQALFKFARA